MNWLRPIPRDSGSAGETYLRAIDGMIYGDSPDQGYVRGGVFIHPRARVPVRHPARIFNPEYALGK